jgi:hypothetical protein
MRDRATQAKSVAVSYALACALYIAAVLFLLAACFTGVFALFRWVELTYGQFWAFGAIAGLLVLLTAVCVLFATRALHSRTPRYPGLVKRLRIAIRSNPVSPGEAPALRNTAAQLLVARPASAMARRNRGRGRRPPSDGGLRLSMVVAAALLGWAAVRRHDHQRGADM